MTSIYVKTKGLLIIAFIFCLNSVCSQNLALNKPTEQSSTYGSETAGQSSNAVDGNTDGVRANNSTTHTNSDDQMWWKVDLGAEYTINEIRVYNRTDGSIWRLEGAEVYIGNVDSNNPADYIKVGSALSSDAEQIINNVSGSGRYIMVYLLKLGNLNKFLSLAEVEVYGSPVTIPTQGVNVALNKPTEQSSTPGALTESQSSNAVDGNTDGVRSNNSITHTSSDDQMWWKVDLGAEYTIDEIRIYNRTDCCTYRLEDAEVYIGNVDSNNPVDYIKVGDALTANAEQIISNISSSGRYVMVYLLKSSGSDKFLSLAEVEVYGSSVSNPNPTTSLWSQIGANINFTTGNVGIGTTNPDAKLAVNGNIHAKEVKVDLVGWPDYVFKENYSIPTLEEVQKHITEKGHLINIPSAKDVEENGIELGEMNKLLLEKIEELTLYVLQLKKELKTEKKLGINQEKRLMGLKARLQKIENLIILK